VQCRKQHEKRKKIALHAQLTQRFFFKRHFNLRIMTPTRVGERQALHEPSPIRGSKKIDGWTGNFVMQNQKFRENENSLLRRSMDQALCGMKTFGEGWKFPSDERKDRGHRNSAVWRSGNCLRHNQISRRSLFWFCTPPPITFCPEVQSRSPPKNDRLSQVSLDLKAKKIIRSST
jgi:hypothetical protein